MRYFFEIAYDGAPYAGWQRQKNALTVQEVVENALSTLLRADVQIVGSGRTDTGVHCLQQFFHADLLEPIESDSLFARLNSFLPEAIAIRSIIAVQPDAHARYSAVQRLYEYRVTTRKDPFQVGRALFHYRHLDLATMNAAAALLVGTHDFESFSKVKTDVNNFFCHVTKAEWSAGPEGLLLFHIAANRFLRGMVRAVVGTLLDVGQQKLSVSGFGDILASKDRRLAGENVVPGGLYLKEVSYPDSIYLPS